MTERTINPNSLANLRPPWRKGDPSPNPAGANKGVPLYKPALRRFGSMTLEQVESLMAEMMRYKSGQVTLSQCSEELRGMSLVEAAALQQFLRSLQADGDRARHDLADRLDGTPSKEAAADADEVNEAWTGVQREIADALRAVSVEG